MRLLFLILFCAYASATKRSFDGYKVYRIIPNSIDDIELLHMIQSESEFEFWNDISLIGENVDIMVNPNSEIRLREMIGGMSSEVLIDNVQELISDDHVERAPKFESMMSWDKYYDLAGINSWLDFLEGRLPEAEVIVAGRSYEGREIKGVRLTFNNRTKTEVVIEAGIHAREWISPATITYFINELLESEDPRLRNIAESFDWNIFPVTNPDGYEYTHTTDRVWRKTRQPYPTHLNCTGVDPNRNWDFDWGVHSTSTNSCSNTFGGPSPFSEPETSGLAQYVESVASNMDVYFSFHSYSQVLLVPYGNSTDIHGNFDDLLAIGTKAIETLKSVHNTTYRVGNTAALMGKTSGTTTDWVKDTFGTPITFTYELRDTGRYGFILPPELIRPNSEEVLESLITIFEEAARMGYFPAEARNRILQRS